MLEYAILRIIWWILLGVLLSGFAIMDGFDLGVAALIPFVGNTDEERRIVINTVGPVWEGNQVWIILGAGAIFAAWPAIYAVAFSSFYLAMLLLLLTFIIRPVGFKYRSKLMHPGWRNSWDWILSIGAIVAAILFGVAVGNVLQGIPFYFDQTLRSFYTGSFWDLLNPFAILCGLISLLMFLMHGGLYLAIKTQAVVQDRAIRFSQVSAALLIVLFAIGGVWVVNGINGFVVIKAIDPNGFSNPLNKQIAIKTGAWLNNYHAHSWMIIAPILGFLGALGSIVLSLGRWFIVAFISSALSIFGVITTVGLSMFPFILPSITNPQSSLLVWDASSSQLTLFTMLIATIIFMPIIIIYTSWVYWVLRGKVTSKVVGANDQSY